MLRFLRRVWDWLFTDSWIEDDPADVAIRNSPRYWTEPESYTREEY